MIKILKILNPFSFVYFFKKRLQFIYGDQAENLMTFGIQDFPVSIELCNSIDDSKISTFDLSSKSYNYKIRIGKLFVGSIYGRINRNTVVVESLQLDLKYQNRGLGASIFKEFLKVASTSGVTSIEGSSPTYLMRFFKRLDAKYECRKVSDYETSLNKFYIDLLPQTTKIETLTI